ncbi:MAG: cation-translocating P-type ATPase [bacterium]|nr:cation-translocating P-type ATPase [bacterium]MDA1024611.1 cation-translocating P-type ATPase [bacterium]
MSASDSQFAWHLQTSDDVLDAFSSSKNGLSNTRAQELFHEYGSNNLHNSKRVSPVHLFFAQFRSPFMIVLIVAAGFSALLTEWLDVSVISTAIIVNVLLGFVEELKADRSLEALKSYLPEEARVRREGIVKVIDVSKVVPGDMMILHQGDQITADGRMVLAEGFEVNEAALTGESMGIAKMTSILAQRTERLGLGDRTNMVFAGTSVLRGNAEFVVTATGNQREIGRIGSLVAEVQDEKTPLQQELDRLARVLSGMVFIIAIVVILLSLLRGTNFVHSLEIAVALAVSAIPEGLAVGVTVILAVGMQRILKKNALVRHIVASETLGSVSVICMDKTGTLTTGDMRVVELRSMRGLVDRESPEGKIIQDIFLHAQDAAPEEANGSIRYAGTPTDIAIYESFARPNSRLTNGKEQLWTGVEGRKRVGSVSFDSEKKYSAKFFDEHGEVTVYAMGAPEYLLKQMDMTDDGHARILRLSEAMAVNGLRVLIAGTRVMEKRDTYTEEDVCDLHFAGAIGLQDPLRESAKKTVDSARQAGLRPVMITGDHRETAASIARQAGILEDDDQVITGNEIDVLSDDALFDVVQRIQVFARVVPEHKLRIVRALRRHNETVAMTGDGVNDAPAIKAADIGLAVGSGTEVSKQTADMVLLDNNFKTIVEAIKEGRIIFDNVRKVVVYLLSGSWNEVLLILVALTAGLPMPLLPIHILWINLVTDGLPSVALTFEPGEKGIMHLPPRPRGERVLSRRLLGYIIVIVIVTNVLLIGYYLVMLRSGLQIEHVRTLLFLKLGIDSLLYIFSIRSLRQPIWQVSPLSNKWLLGAVFCGLLLHVFPVIIPALRTLFGFTSIRAEDVFLLAILAILNLVLIEGAKAVYNLRKKAYGFKQN